MNRSYVNVNNMRDYSPADALIDAREANRHLPERTLRRVAEALRAENLVKYVSRELGEAPDRRK